MIFFERDVSYRSEPCWQGASYGTPSRPATAPTQATDMTCCTARCTANHITPICSIRYDMLLKFERVFHFKFICKMQPTSKGFSHKCHGTGSIANSARVLILMQISESFLASCFFRPYKLWYLPQPLYQTSIITTHAILCCSSLWVIHLERPGMLRTYFFPSAISPDSIAHPRPRKSIEHFF